jgi:Type I restriction-modification system methyltransferase subunit
MPKEKTSISKSNGSSLDFENQLWAAADKMRGHMDASEYKHVCLGLIFLKYISDAFEEKREQLLFGFSDPKSEWFIKDEPQRAEAAENHSLSALIGERAGVRCRNPQINRRRIHGIRGKRWPCASTTTWKLARMNLAIRDFSLSASNGERVGVRCRIPRNADSFRQDLHPDLKADFILANPPFNMSDWGGENLRPDVRWKFGMPPVNNANYAWSAAQHGQLATT